MIQLKIRSRKSRDPAFVDKVIRAAQSLINLVADEQKRDRKTTPLVLIMTEVAESAGGIILPGSEQEKLLDNMVKKQNILRSAV